MTRRSVERPVARAALVAIAIVAVVVPATASASPLLELIGGPSGGGFNARAAGAGPETTYFNPALLSGQVESFDVSLFGVGSTLSIDVADRPAGVDLLPSIYDAWLGDGAGGITPLEDPPLATEDLSPRQANNGITGFKSYIGFGAVKHVVGRKLVFGFYGAVPTSQIQGHSVFYADEREQYFSNSLRFELYDDRMTMPTFVFAVGSRINELLSVGVGFVAAIDTRAATPVYVPDGADLGSVYLGQSLTVDTKAAPHFGAELRPMRGVRVTAAVHTPSSVDVRGENQIRLPNGTVALQEFHFTHGYQPLTLALGTAFDALDCPGRRVTVVGNATWRNWESYKDRHSEAPLDPWRNTVSLSLGGRYQTGDTELFADATYVPTPVPDQTGRQNYVDNTRLGLHAGMNAHTRLFGTRVAGGFFVQGHTLLERSVQKSPDAAHPVIDEFPDNAVDPAVDPGAFLPEAQGLQTNNPGYPGFSSSGFVIAAGVSMRMNF